MVLITNGKDLVGGTGNQCKGPGWVVLVTNVKDLAGGTDN